MPWGIPGTFSAVRQTVEECPEFRPVPSRAILGREMGISPLFSEICRLSPKANAFMWVSEIIIIKEWNNARISELNKAGYRSGRGAPSHQAPWIPDAGCTYANPPVAFPWSPWRLWPVFFPAPGATEWQLIFLHMLLCPNSGHQSLSIPGTLCHAVCA